MKKIALTAALVAFAGVAVAGNPVPMTTEAPMEVVMDDTPAGYGALGWIIPLVAIAAIALAADN